MSVRDLEEILNTPTEELRPEPQLPAGHWRFTCKTITIRTREDGSQSALLTLSPIEPATDVDPAAAEEWHTESDEDAVVFHSVRGSLRSIEAQLKAIAAAVGVTKPAELTGATFYAEVVYDANKRDPERPWLRLRNFSIDEPAPTEDGEQLELF